MEEKQIAYVRILPSNIMAPTGVLIIDECPYCGGSHKHGMSPEADGTFGARVAHCCNREYVLVDILQKKSESVDH